MCKHGQSCAYIYTQSEVQVDKWHTLCKNDRTQPLHTHICPHAVDKWGLWTVLGVLTRNFTGFASQVSLLGLYTSWQEVLRHFLGVKKLLTLLCMLVLERYWRAVNDVVVVCLSSENQKIFTIRPWPFFAPWKFKWKSENHNSCCQYSQSNCSKRQCSRDDNWFLVTETIFSFYILFILA